MASTFLTLSLSPFHLLASFHQWDHLSSVSKLKTVWEEQKGQGKEKGGKRKSEAGGSTHETFLIAGGSGHGKIEAIVV